jgi:hypothetical protein
MLLLPSLCQCSVCSKRAPHLYPRIHENSMPWMFTSLFQEILPGKRSEKYSIRKPNQETLQIFSRCPRRLRVLITSASGLAVLERPMSITIFCVNYFSNFRRYRKRSERVAVPGSAITHCFAGPPETVLRNAHATHCTKNIFISFRGAKQSCHFWKANLSIRLGSHVI